MSESAKTAMEGLGEAVEAFWISAASQTSAGAWKGGGWPFAWGSALSGSDKEGVSGESLGLEERWIETDLGRTRYWLRRPSGREGQRLPLMVMLHGCKQSAPDFALGSAMIQAAEREGVILVYPEQDGGRVPGRCWRWFEPAHQERGSGEPALIAAIAKAVINEEGADESRVFVAGLSAGGAMALLTAKAYPEVFAAAGCHSGLAPGSAEDARSALLAMRKGPSDRAAIENVGVPTIVFHGLDDKTVASVNGELCFESASDGNAEISESLVRGGRRVSRRWREGTRAPRAELWLIEGAAHAWSGGNELGSHAEAAGPSAAEEILRFCLAQRR